MSDLEQPVTPSDPKRKGAVEKRTEKAALKKEARVESALKESQGVKGASNKLLVVLDQV